MKLFDLHCDTPYELYERNAHLEKNDLHISLEKSKVFSKYVQCAAVWSRNDLSDRQCFDAFFKIAENFCNESPYMIATRESLLNAPDRGFILTVEDGRLISENTDDVFLLSQKGVRILTLFWKDESALGGAWNTDCPITPTGIEVIEKCFDAKIIPDLSHANDRALESITKMAKSSNVPVIATHSNARSVCGHLRNLSDEGAAAIANTGGIIGISLYPPHLFGDRADIHHIVAHIEHYVNLTGEDTVCLGCDFDGISKTPDGIEHIGHLPRLFEALSSRLGSSIAEKVFYNNAYNFFLNYLPK